MWPLCGDRSACEHTTFLIYIALLNKGTVKHIVPVNFPKEIKLTPKGAKIFLTVLMDRFLK